MAIHLLGIRHHGPGSCRNVLKYLQDLQPDLILVEGPPEAAPLLSEVLSPEMKPPIALLAYQADQPHHAVFYPFAEFSPEWQALCYALKQGISIQFFDLPLIYTMADQQAQSEETEKDQETDNNSKTIEEDLSIPNKDPFDYLAEISGLEDGEAWWETFIEHRKDNNEIFAAVEEAVTALRQALPEYTSQRDLKREAWMRKMLRSAQKEEGVNDIVVICGAWHVPALREMPKVKDDDALLKGMSKVKVECTWIPWTYDRLSMRSGYGAGILSPGWYDYLWHHPNDDGTLWMSRVAKLLRSKDMDISVAHVIETVRLAEATAALRGLPSPSLAEYNEAITTVMGFGDEILLEIIREELIISDRMGNVPDTVPKVPLLIDVEKTQKRLRVPFSAEIKELILDLRKPNDLQRSIFFHRLHLLEIGWVQPEHIDGKGTFKEKWTLHHQPEDIIKIIERAIWGNTIEEATKKYLLHRTHEIKQIPELTLFLNQIIPADLPDLVDAMIVQLDRLSAASSDIVQMMEAIPHLVSIVRYGNVRDQDFTKIGDMLHAMIARILSGGILICINIDEESAAQILSHLNATDYAVSTLNDDALTEMWLEFIKQVQTASNAHPLLSGYATRLLHDKGLISFDETQKTFSFYSSVGTTAIDMAHWFEGFLHASGSILLLDDDLWRLINDWICSQGDEAFVEILPILKRTFSEFTTAERRKLGEKAKSYDPDRMTTQKTIETSYNKDDAEKIIPLICRLLGLSTN